MRDSSGTHGLNEAERIHRLEKLERLHRACDAQLKYLQSLKYLTANDQQLKRELKTRKLHYKEEIIELREYFSTSPMHAVGS